MGTDSDATYAYWSQYPLVELTARMWKTLNERDKARSALKHTEDEFDQIIRAIAYRMGRLTDAVVDLGAMPKFDK